VGTCCGGAFPSSLPVYAVARGGGQAEAPGSCACRGRRRRGRTSLALPGGGRCSRAGNGGLVFPLVRIVSVPGGRAWSGGRVRGSSERVSPAPIRLVPRVRTDHRARASGPARLRSRARHQLHSVLGVLGAIGRGRAPRPPAEPSRGLRRRRHAARARRRRGPARTQRTGRGQVIDAAMGDGAAQLATIRFSFAASGGWGPTGTNVLDTGSPSTTSTNPRTAASWRFARSSPVLRRPASPPRDRPRRRAAAGTARWPELGKRLSDGPLDGLSRPSSGIEAGRPGQVMLSGRLSRRGGPRAGSGPRRWRRRRLSRTQCGRTQRPRMGRRCRPPR